jgi:hypothetical protein
VLEQLVGARRAVDLEPRGGAGAVDAVGAAVGVLVEIREVHDRLPLTSSTRAPST